MIVNFLQDLKSFLKDKNLHNSPRLNKLRRKKNSKQHRSKRRRKNQTTKKQ